MLKYELAKERPTLLEENTMKHYIGKISIYIMSLFIYLVIIKLYNLILIIHLY